MSAPLPSRNAALGGPKLAALFLLLAPLGWLVADIVLERLGANPVETVLHRTGDWALRFLLLTLAVTPLRRVTGWQWPMRFRRMLGLVAFAYALLHALTWLVLDRGLVWDEVAADVLERPYVTLGFGAFALLLPLALTSTRGMMRRLGRHWQRLHRSVYVAAALAVLHYVWLAKIERPEPIVYGVILLALLLARLPLRWRTTPVGA